MQGVQEAHDTGDLCGVRSKGEVDVTGADGYSVAVNLERRKGSMQDGHRVR